MYLETLCHEQSLFVTLTYSDDNLPSNGTLVPRDAKLWLKRFRERISPLKIRFYLVGEYGDQTERPHYHVALFGVGFEFEKIIEDTWKKGHVHIGDLTLHSAQYITGYVTKKMTSTKDDRLNGRHPEFARMSLKPGIGALAIDELARVVGSPHARAELEFTGDVPTAFRSNGRSLPLGRYLRGKLRKELSLERVDPQTGEITYATPYKKIFDYQLEVHSMWLDAQNDPKYTKEEKVNVRSVLERNNRQKILNLETKTKIFEKGKTL